MAGMLFRVPFKDVTLTATTARTILLVKAPTNIRLKLRRLAIFANGTTGTNEPILVDLNRCSTDGSLGTSSGNTSKNDASKTETIQTTVYTGTVTTEPTVDSTHSSYRFHPQNGMFEALDGIEVKGGERWAVKLTADNTVDVSGYLELEE